MKKHIIFSALVLATVVFTGCRKDNETQVFSFGASIPQPTYEEEGEKVIMHGERLIYFQNGDKISVASDIDETPNREKGPMIGDFNSKLDGAGYDGVFMTYLDIESKKFCAVYPQHDDIAIEYNDGTFTANSWFPRVQDYVNDETFGRLDYPMVSYAYRDSAYFEFHALCGIVRVQFYAPSGKITIDSIQFISKKSDEPLSGFFDVKDMTSNVPYVTASTRTSDTVSIKCEGGISATDLKSFYVTLPATSKSNHKYEMSMILYGKKDGTTISKTLRYGVEAWVQPRSITRLSAINIDDWIDYYDTHTGNPVGISGNGTQDRPFEIYNANDLVKIRDAFSTDGKLNGIQVKGRSDTVYYSIMRSDIVLNTTNWTSGINGFEGKMTYNSSSTHTPGITNISGSPLFASIATNGKVVGVSIKGVNTVTVEPLTTTSGIFSPFCGTNSGTIEGCHINQDFKCENTNSGPLGKLHLAGICAINSGTIKGCHNKGYFNAGSGASDGKNVAGICYENSGIISECNVVSPGQIYGKEIGGICHTNLKTIEGCYFAASLGSGVIGNFGGIAFLQDNSGAKITKCQLQTSFSISTSGTCGGIVNTMTNGELNYCGNVSTYSSSSKLNGGIVASISGGKIINCYCDNEGYTIYATGSTGDYCGGIAGEMKGGEITNSYSTADVSGPTGGAGSVVGNYSGGTITACYGWSGTGVAHEFCGKTASSTAFSNCYNFDPANAHAAPSGVTPFAATYLTTLINNLNAAGEGYSWTEGGASFRHPVLVLPTSKARRLQRRK